jgi:hypothetical protein
VINILPDFYDNRENFAYEVYISQLVATLEPAVCINAF